MTPRLATWRDVTPGCYVRDEKGRVWRVAFDRENRKIVLTGRDGVSGAIDPPPGSQGVIIMEPTEAEALATLADKVGGEAVATKQAGDKLYKCQPFPTRQSQRTMIGAKAHIFMFHATWAGDIKTMAALRAAHDDLHNDLDNYVPHGYLPHHH